LHGFQPLYTGVPQLYRALTEPTLSSLCVPKDTFITFPILKSHFGICLYNHSSIQSFAAHWAQAHTAMAENA